METSEEDEGLDSLRLKRKLTSSKEKEPDLVKKQRVGKSSSKTRDNSVFAALCSTLSQLPTSKKVACSIQKTPCPADENKVQTILTEENQPVDSTNSQDRDKENSSDEENHSREKESSTANRNCSDCLHNSSDNRQLSGEDCPLIPPKSSPEMAVNGS